MPPPVLIPDWPAPPAVRALQTLRAAHGEMPDRDRVAQELELPSAPRWLRQVHGTAVAQLPSTHIEPQADASFTRAPGVVCAVMTADCLPVLLCDAQGSAVAVAHAGWRGLCAGVIEETVRALQLPGARLLAWLGAGIGPQAFEVGEEVRDAFVAADAHAHLAFRPGVPGKHYADLYALARQRLARAGVSRVWGGGLCTYSDPARFFSYRRGAPTGRMLSLIWIERKS